ncbi:ClbS/DfsB family four-helix bundle protein [Chitiniphilus eburneus]|uniref:ClbS/DfsB family four-helix bundle protein n=1 Tax=Chitiniphilus eburneus TaxID=2571148 RepID=A0A4U0Q3H8_9NEIS|nr:ClbS/DfsB family four-helix bundle protein [Chitiniphilus eburneus]TJZ75525.1 ClbS/DfsB family four-helix bundle protein [Chitiniphilus eburneus]
MPIPRTRAELRDAMTDGHRRLNAELDRVEHAGLSTLSCVDDWTIHDTLAVRTGWAEMTLAWIEAGLRGENPATPAPGYSWQQTPQLNRAIVDRAASCPWHTLRLRLDAAMAALLRLVETLPDAQLLEPHQFAWTRNWAVLRWIAVNTATQHVSLRTMIRHALKNAGER